MAQKTEDRGDADLDLSPGEPVPQFAQCDVRLLCNPVRQPFGEWFQRIFFISAEFCRSKVSLGTPELEELTHRLSLLRAVLPPLPVCTLSTERTTANRRSTE